MNKNIAILRGINVGGRRKILMADLRELFAKLGFTNITTYIQSGNVFFNSKTPLTNIEMEDKIAQAISEQYGFEVPVIIRSAQEIADAVKNSPFFQDQTIKVTPLHLTFLKEIPSEENLLKIATYNYEPDKFVIQGANVFLYCEGKYHKSKLTNNFFEKKLKVAATTRNWKTVLQLLALSHPNKTV